MMRLLFTLVSLTILSSTQCNKIDYYPAMRDEVANLYKKIHPWSYIPWNIIDLPFLYKEPPQKTLPDFSSDEIYFDVGLGKRGSPFSLDIAKRREKPLLTKGLLLKKLELLAQRAHHLELPEDNDKRRQSLAHS
ncbi:uncharacterized protein LOC115210315 [Octopus sinensis]|uniref:Uncharacterized protein LOC115210315 n=1 Tax=Octopus sinensis TaxID=2607531 RepID=A0A6P7S947_9MOLL|nr:uncharacterized protein LOC115210315 [Octopus sinensis]XP_036358553.1 uncharacterized protein LOC115210315 [Octopus sinensis]